MELVYIYIAEYGCLRDVGFNLSDKYEIRYEASNNQLTIKKSDLVIENFWHENIKGKDEGLISNLCTIVGDNGAGKTTILRLIREFYYFEKQYSNNDCFFMFMQNEGSNGGWHFEVVCCGKFIGNQFGNSVTPYSINPYKYPHRTIPSFEEGFNEDLNEYVNSRRFNRGIFDYTKVIYTNTNLDLNDYSTGSRPNIFNLSLGNLIYQEHLQNLGKIDYEYDKIIYFFSQETLNQFIFLLEYDFNLPFKKPKYLKIRINSFNGFNHSINLINESDKNKIISLMSSKDEYSYSIEKLKGIFNNKYLVEENTDNEKVIIMIIESVIKSYIREGLIRTNHKEEFIVSCLYAINNFFTNKEEKIENIIDKYVAWLVNANNKMESSDVVIDENKNAKIIIDITPYREFLEWLKNNYDNITKENYIRVFNQKDYLLQVATDEKNRIFLEELIRHYQKTSKENSYLHFSWDLSSGEFNLLSFYSRLYSKSKELHSVPYEGGSSGLDCENLLILMDEPDLSFHPRWQQEYVKAILEFIPKIYRRCDIKIIITTHSPIMLSDIPKKNVIFLKKHNIDDIERHKETFGQNIYTLFNDAFFINNNSIGIIGKFAYSRIEDVNIILDAIMESQKMANKEFEKAIQDIKSFSNIEELMSKEILTIQEASIRWCQYIISNIGESIIKTELERKLIMVKREYHSSDLNNIIDGYDKLSKEEQKKLIEYIIEKNNRGSSNVKN